MIDLTKIVWLNKDALDMFLHISALNDTATEDQKDLISCSVQCVKMGQVNTVQALLDKK